MCKKLVFIHSEDDRNLLVWWVNWITCRKSPCITPWIVCRKSPCVTLNYVPKISIYNSVNCVPKISAYHFVNYVQEISIYHCLLSFSYVQQIFMYHSVNWMPEISICITRWIMFRESSGIASWILCRKSSCITPWIMCWKSPYKLSLREVFAGNLRISLRELGYLWKSLHERPLIFLTRVLTRQSVVGIATGYGLDGPGIESRWGLDFPYPSRTAPQPIHLTVKWVPRIFPGGKAAEAWL
jgi:hypothetical protein